MIKEFNVIIVGVGGQGLILMSELLGHAAIASGLNVKGSETLGIAQRGAPVSTMLRLGSVARGPIIPQGRGDIMIAMEPVEALRNICYLSKSSIILLNTQRIIPMPVLLGDSTYPSLERITEKLNKYSARVIVIDAAKLAEEAGSSRSPNIVMLGAAFGTGALPLELEAITKAIKTRFPGTNGLSNMRAFEAGYQHIRANS